MKVTVKQEDTFISSFS